MIEFDIESTGLQWYADELFLAQFLGDGDPALINHRPSAGRGTSTVDREAIQAHLRHPTHGYRAWNSKFDLHFLDAAGYDLPPESSWHDGMVAAHILDERYSVALQNKGNALFGEESAGADTEARLRAFLTEERARRRKIAKSGEEPFVAPNYSDVPWDIMEPYAAHDVILQREVCDVVMPALQRNPDYVALYEMERKVLGAMFHAERRGIPMDRERLAALEGDLLPKLDEAEAACIAVSGFRNFNPRSPKQISEALDRLGADTRYMTRSTSTKLLKTDEENLNACPHPLAEAILHYRGIHRLFVWVHRILHGKPEDDKFPAPYLTSDGRVHPDFKQIGPATGRMACANPNFQNLHRDDLRPRYCVRATPGNKLVCVDLDQIELRLLAAFAGEGALLNMIRTGADMHTHTAEMVGLKGRRRSTGAIEKPRDQGKRFNYLKPYGGGNNAIRKFFLVDQREAGVMMARYEEAYPEVKRLEERIEIALMDKGYIKTPWGRRHRVKYNAEREAYQFVARLLQGTAADLFKDAAAKVHQQGVPLIAFVHDEMIAEVPEADAEEAGRVMVEALTNHPVITDKVPLTAEAQIVDAWSDAKKPGYVPDHERTSP